MFEKLKIDFEIPEELDDAINDLVYDMNNGRPDRKDIRQDEINFWLKDWSNGLTNEQIELLRDYYIRRRF